MPKDTNTWFFLLLSYSWKLTLKRAKKRKRYFYVRPEEMTLGVCHRLDRKSHYKLTPELELQLTTSTARAFSDRPPSWKKNLCLGGGKAVPTSLLGLGWEFLVLQPLQPGMCCWAVAAVGSGSSSLSCCWLLFFWWFMFLVVHKAHCMHCGHFRCSWKVCREKNSCTVKVSPVREQYQLTGMFIALVDQ